MLAWVEQHAPSAWVAIDDLDLRGLPADRFVQTDPSAGLTTLDAARAVQLLLKVKPVANA